MFLVWNKDKTEGFVTLNEQIAYEARKGADSNCFSIDGVRSDLAIAFCDVYSHTEDCTIQTTAYAEVNCKECTKLKHMYKSAKKQTDSHVETIKRIRKEAEKDDNTYRQLLGEAIEKNQELREKIDKICKNGFEQVDKLQTMFNEISLKVKGMIWGVRLLHVIYLSIIAYMYWG